MDTNTVMRRYGYYLTSTGGSYTWYTKPLKHYKKKVLIEVTDNTGRVIPKEITDPVLVGIYDIHTGEELVHQWHFESLKEYLESDMIQKVRGFIS